MAQDPVPRALLPCLTTCAKTSCSPIWCPIPEPPSSWLSPWSRHDHHQVLCSISWQYELGDGALQKFNAHSYKRAWVLRFITLDNVTTIGLCLGEIAELHDAIERWSVARKMVLTVLHLTSSCSSQFTCCIIYNHKFIIRPDDLLRR